MFLKGKGSKKPYHILTEKQGKIIEYVQVMKILPLERKINVIHLSELVQVSHPVKVIE